jgi:hypothetical protein
MYQNILATDEEAGIVCILTAVVSTTAMRYQILGPTLVAFLGFCQSEDTNAVIVVVKTPISW